MANSRFLVLPDPLPAQDLESFIGRIVSETAFPLNQFAPFPSSGVPPHNTNHILPAILPVPNKWTSCQEASSIRRERGISSLVPLLIKAELPCSGRQSKTLTCEEMRRYVLPNPTLCFQTLMANQHYAKDVQGLLKDIWPHRAYFVTGFITATNSTWSMHNMRESKPTVGVDLSGTASLLSGMPLSEVTQVGVKVHSLFTREQVRNVTAEGEEIIAVSYSTVTLSYGISSTTHFISRTPKIGRPLRIDASHLSMAEEDDAEVLDWDSSDDEAGYAADASDKVTHDAAPPSPIFVLDEESTVLQDAPHVIW